jgi:hypothetical protein
MAVVSWILVIALLFRRRDHSLHTISRHAVKSIQARIVFAVILIGGGTVVYSWLLLWFRPHLELGMLFKVVLSATFAAQFITALAPDLPGRRRSVHQFAAFGMAGLYIPLALLIITAPRLDVFARFTDVVLLSYMLLTLIVVAILGKAKRRYLIFQTLYIASMQAIILVSAYL